MRTTALSTYIKVGEGEPWGPLLRAGGIDLRDIQRFDEKVEPRLGRRLVTYRKRDGAPIAGHGIAGYFLIGEKPLYVVPKCFSQLSGDEFWGAAIPSVLAMSRGNVAEQVMPTGDGSFVTSKAMAWWWADRFGRSTLRALSSHRLLGYRRDTVRETTVRGRIVWSRQVTEFARGGHRVHTRRARYVADIPVNQLLSWAARRLLAHARTGATRGRLHEVLERIGVADVTPTRHDVASIRLTPAQREYRECLNMARALYDSKYPTLQQGSLPAQGFLIDMQDTFELFVNGLVHRAGRGAPIGLGGPWAVASQDTALLARVQGHGRDITTEPDNTVAIGSTGVVVDAKYKGVASDRGGSKYQQPRTADVYQLLAGSIARGWRRAIIISPAVDGATRQRGPWRIEIAGNDSVTLAHLLLDLRLACSAEGRRELVQTVRSAISTALD